MFPSHKSYTTQQLLVSVILSKRIEYGLDTYNIFRFSKGLCHKRLLLKVEKAGIQGQVFSVDNVDYSYLFEINSTYNYEMS